MIKVGTFTHGDYKLGIYVGQYANQTRAVELVCLDELGRPTEPFTTLSVNLSGASEMLQSRHPEAFYAKGWSENEGLVERMETQGLVRKLEEFPPAATGYVVAFPYELTQAACNA